MTFTIVGRTDDGRFGVATSTARSAVGGRCCFVGEAGAVATQGMVRTGLAIEVLAELGHGTAPADAVERVVRGDGPTRSRPREPERRRRDATRRPSR